MELCVNCGQQIYDAGRATTGPLWVHSSTGVAQCYEAPVAEPATPGTVNVFRPGAEVVR